jgi:hypothetical protein
MSSWFRGITGLIIIILAIFLLVQYEKCKINDRIIQKLKKENPILYDRLLEQAEQEEEERRDAKFENIISHGTE